MINEVKGYADSLKLWSELIYDKAKDLLTNYINRKGYLANYSDDFIVEVDPNLIDKKNFKKFKFSEIHVKFRISVSKEQKPHRQSVGANGTAYMRSEKSFLHKKGYIGFIKIGLDLNQSTSHDIDSMYQLLRKTVDHELSHLYDYINNKIDPKSGAEYAFASSDNEITSIYPIDKLLHYLYVFSDDEIKQIIAEHRHTQYNEYDLSFIQDSIEFKRLLKKDFDKYEYSISYELFEKKFGNILYRNFRDYCKQNNYHNTLNKKIKNLDLDDCLIFFKKYFNGRYALVQKYKKKFKKLNK